jgi:hypothetical protein
VFGVKGLSVLSPYLNEPPHEFRRTPRSIESTLNYWKASEFRAWLLFYSIPILFGFLHRDYLHHINLLVKSMHILLSSHISSSDLLTAERMLKIFYERLLICILNRYAR